MTFGEYNKSLNGFCYYYDDSIPLGAEVYLKTPLVSPNKRGVNDIGFAYAGDIELFATLSQKHDDENAVWQQIQPYDEINKTVSWIRIKNVGAEPAKVNIKLIMF